MYNSPNQQSVLIWLDLSYICKEMNIAMIKFSNVVPDYMNTLIVSVLKHIDLRSGISPGDGSSLASYTPL